MLKSHLTCPFVRIASNEVTVNDLASVEAIHKIDSGFNKSLWYPSITGGSLQPRLGILAQTDPKIHSARGQVVYQPFSKSGIQEWEDMLKHKAELAVARMGKVAKENVGMADTLE